MSRSSLQLWGNAEGDPVSSGNGGGWPLVDVVLLTGVDRFSLDAVSFSLTDSCPSVCAVMYDVRADDGCEAGYAVVCSELNPMAFGEGSRRVIGEDECCLTCAVKHDLSHVLADSCGRSDVLLVCLPLGLEGTAVARYLDGLSVLGELPCVVNSTVVATAVGLNEFESELFDDDQLCLCGSGDDAVLDSRSRGVVASRLIREAGHILELPLVDSGSSRLHDVAEANRRVRDADRIVRVLADPLAIVHADAHAVDLHDLVAADCTAGRLVAQRRIER